MRSTALLVLVVLLTACGGNTDTAIRDAAIDTGSPDVPAAPDASPDAAVDA